MSLTKKMQEQGGKPSGLFGTVIAIFINGDYRIVLSMKTTFVLILGVVVVMQ